MSKALSVPISAARAGLFDLFEEVMEDKVSRVIIEHRDFAEHAVLVREGYLNMLESRVKQAEGSEKPFKLFGSAKLVGDPNTVVEDIRARQAALSKVKLDTI